MAEAKQRRARRTDGPLTVRIELNQEMSDMIRQRAVEQYRTPAQQVKAEVMPAIESALGMSDRESEIRDD